MPESAGRVPHQCLQPSGKNHTLPFAREGVSLQSPDLSSHYFCSSPIHQAQLFFSPRPPCIPADPLNKTADANLSERKSAVLQDQPTHRVEQESKKSRQSSRLMDYYLVFIVALHVNRLSPVRWTREPTHINFKRPLKF